LNPQLAKRHKVEVDKDGSPDQQSMKRISTYDEGALDRLPLEISLLDSAYQRFGRSEEDALANAAKRYRVEAGAQDSQEESGCVITEIH
jgi:hypothetical protein